MRCGELQFFKREPNAVGSFESLSKYFFDKFKRPAGAGFVSILCGKSGLFRLLRGLGEELFDLGHAVVFQNAHRRRARCRRP